MRVRHLLILFIFKLLFYSGAAQDIHLDLVALPKEEPWKSIRGLVQDPQGFLWIATAGGLYRYDGYKCVAYHHEPSNLNTLISNRLECIYGGKDNFLLIGTFGSGLDLFDLTTGHFTHYRFSPKDASTLSNDTVTAIIKGGEGQFWIGTHDGLNRFDPKTGIFTRYKSNPHDDASLSDNQVRALFEDHQGTLWVGTKSPWEHDGGSRVGGLNRLDLKTSKFVRYMHDPRNAESLIDNRITAIFEDSRGTLWIGTANNGLDILNRETGTFEHHVFNLVETAGKQRQPETNAPPPPVVPFITFISEDPNGNIWIGTLGDGMHVYNPYSRQTAHFGTEKTSKQKLADNIFVTTLTSSEGVFWVSAWGTNLYKVYPYKKTLPYTTTDKAVSNFYEASDGTLWMTTFQGLLHKNKNGTIQQFVIDKSPASKSNFMRTIQEDTDHNLWIGTAYNGLYHFNPITQKFTAYLHQPGNAVTLLCDSVNTITKAADNKLWIGTYNGLDQLNLSTMQFTHYPHDPKEATFFDGGNFSDQGNASVSSIAISRNHTVWYCVGGDVKHLDDQTGQIKKYSFDNEYAYSILEDSKGTIWVGSYAGLFQYNYPSDRFIHFYDSTGIINRYTTIVNIIEDKQHNLWLKTNTGFIQLNLVRKEAGIFHNIDHNYSWPIQKSYVTSRGEILSGDTSGYFSFHPDSLFTMALRPNIVVTNFYLDDEPVKPGTRMLSGPVSQMKTLYLKHDQNRFSFEFTSIDFMGSSEDGHILYSMENYDPKWRKADAERLANYYNVPPGKYIFRIKAMHTNGAWGEKELAIHIAPPWWRTWWAYCLYVLFFMAGVYVVHRLQKQRVIRIERERTKERELAQAKEIEKAYTQLKATQAQLIQSEKMASLGELTAGIAHEIQNPLNFVNNFSETNVELLDEAQEELKAGNQNEALSILDDIKENESKINHHGRRADSIVKGMLEHSRMSKGEKQPVEINRLVDEYLRLAYHGFRAKDKSFNANIETHFDDSIDKLDIIPQDVGRVLLNLFNNAFYAIAERKNQTGEGYEPTISVSTKKTDVKIEISVRDNGRGIPKSLQDKIFQPFFTTKPAGEGTGLGLSLSYDIIKAHGGELKVESVKGEGAAFMISLPL